MPCQTRRPIAASSAQQPSPSCHATPVGVSSAPTADPAPRQAV
ncbi:hypothetical protein [Amycolatopsis plumensis]